MHALLLLAPLLGAAPAPSTLPSQARLERAFRDAVAAVCRKAVSFDPALTRASRRFAEAAAAGTSPVEASALSFYASLESAEPSPFAGLSTVAPAAEADRAVADLFPRGCGFERAGIAAAVLEGERAVVAVLTAARGAELSPIPGRVRAGATVKLRGRLLPGLARPRLYVRRPSGGVDEVPVALAKGRFSAAVRLSARGETRLELLADGKGGPQVLAARRVFVGVAPPAHPPAGERGAGGLPGIAKAIDALRASRGLAPLRRDPVLDKVAEGHSAEMARLRTFAHVLPSDGSVADRLRKRGYPYRSAGENIGLADTPEAAHAAIVGSPAHLANLLDPRHRNLGLGVARGALENGAEGVYLTEVLAAPVVTVADPAEAAAVRLAGERRRRGLVALARDSRLDRVAEREVGRAVAADRRTTPPEAAAAALAAAPELRGAAAELEVVGAPDEVGSSRTAAESRWTRFGIAARYADSRTLGAGRLWVVLVFGR